MKKISIITINFNDCEGLKQTVASVLQQSFRDFEYIVIDGGSNDGSREFIESNSRSFAYWVSEKDKGIYDAMNKGIKQAKGEYLLFLNSGDYLFHPNVFQNMSEYLNGEKDIVYGDMKIDDGGELKDGFMPDKITLEQMMRDTLWHPVSFIKRTLFEKFGLYKTEYSIVADYEFFFNVIIDKKVSVQHAKEFVCVFDLKGISSRPENVQLIKNEKEKVKRTYLSEQQIADFEKVTQRPKNNFFTRWFR